MQPTADLTDTPPLSVAQTRDPVEPAAEQRIAQIAPDTRPTAVIRAPTISIRSLRRALRQLIHYRDLLYTLSVHRVKVRYKQSVLGPSWAVLQPLSLMLIYTVVFSRIARVPSEGAPYALFAYTALLP